MQTEKDAEIVGWVGRVGAAGAEHVMSAFRHGSKLGLCTRLSRLVADGLLEAKDAALPPAGVVCGDGGRVALAGP